jgi:HD-like signal output (HDOD) protein/GGDEF domain-containing protein
MKAGGLKNIDELVDRCSEVYSLPSVAVRVLALAQSPTVDVRAIKECIENDPALTSKVLRVVNSSLFGLSREVSDLTQAIALLGINPLKLLVLGFSLPSALFVDVNRDILRSYWRRTLVKAIAAREISQMALGKLGDEAFLAGLLQDLGQLVLFKEIGDEYSRLLMRAAQRGYDIAAAEQAHLGFDHVTLSARLLEKWRLPRAVVTAMEAAPDRDKIHRLENPDRSLAEVLFAADLVAALLIDNRTEVLSELLNGDHNGLRLTHAQLAPLVATLGSRVDQLASALELDLPASCDYQAVLIEAHARLSTVAREVAEQLLARQPATEHEEPFADIADTQHSDADAGGLAQLTATVAAAADHFGAAEALSARPLLPERRTAGPESRVARDRYTTEDIELDPGFVGRLTAAVAACRQARTSISVLMVEMDEYDELLLLRGKGEAEWLFAQLGNLCRDVGHPGASIVQSRDLQYAVILPACDRRQAVSLANDLIARTRPATTRPATTRHGAADAVVLTISVGVATVALPPKNFPATELIVAAERCLNGARLSGGNAVKSIEIY